ncbi:MAG: hypothetical protein AB8G77_07695 [Rhodothermales bacterium]
MMAKKSEEEIITKAAAQILTEHIKDHNLSMSDLAKKGSIPAAALSNLKNVKRPLTQDLAVRLAGAIDQEMGPFFMDLMSKSLEIQKKEYIQTSDDVIFAGLDYTDAIIRNMMHSLQKDDIYWLVSIEPPIEFKESTLDKTLIRCIENGSYIRYIFPKVTYESMRADEQKNLAGILSYHDSIELHNRFFVWQQGFIERHPKHKMLIKKHVECYFAPLQKSFMFFSPFIKYILIEHAEYDGEQQEPAAWLDASYSNQTLEGLDRQKEERCALPLGVTAAKILSLWCNKNTERLQSEDLSLHGSTG